MARTLDVIDDEIREVKGRTFKHLGDLLIEIVDRKLYQDRGFTNVEDYFQNEPNLPSARQAFRLISATRFSRQLPGSVPQPKSERQVRPLLGRNREEAKLLWAIAALVATDRGCTLDGKVVASVTKDFDDGCLREFIPDACALLGESVVETNASLGTTRRAKKRSADSPPTTTSSSSQKRRGVGEDTVALAVAVADMVRRLHHVVHTGDPLCLHAPATGTHQQSSRPKRTRSDNNNGEETEVHLNTTLREIFIGIADLSRLFTLASAPTRLVPAGARIAPVPPRQGSSQEELTVAEALLNLSNDMTIEQQKQLSMSYANLLQEFLLALLGHTGDVFVDTAPPRDETGVLDPDAPSFAISQHVSWVSTPDRLLLNELVQLGYHYQAFEEFVEEEGTPVTDRNESRASVYRRALAAGVSELQQVYQGAVLRIQQHLSSDVTPVLPSIRHFLLDYQTLFPQIHRLLYMIITENLRGSRLLAALCEMGRSGLPVLQSCIQRLLWQCNQVLYKQLSAWMVHGLLIDRTREFFIQVVNHSTEYSREDSATSSIEFANGDVWSTEFETIAENIPPYLDPECAERINFIGQAVRLLRHPKGGFEGADLLPYADTLDCSHNLQSLQERAEFNRIAFDRTIESIRSKVASHLWHLVVVKAELLLHLEALKNYFLLSKGEFYHNFIVDSKKLMELPPREATAESDLNIPFMQSSLKSNAQHDKLFQAIRLKWSREKIPIETKTHLAVHVPQYHDGWDHLYLSFKVEWPLGLIITPALLSRYNALFQFIIKLKRVQLELEEAWQIMCSYRVRDNKKMERHGHRLRAFLTPSRQRLAQIRHHMGHFVLNLQIYLQHDVIESNFAELKEDILQSQDFMKAARRHEEYVEALMLQAFLMTQQISEHIQEIFKYCHTACVFIKSDDGTDNCEAADLRKVLSLGHDFDSAIQNVYSLLQSARLQEQSRGPYLKQLFIRLNFNDYIAKGATFSVGLDNDEHSDYTVITVQGESKSGLLNSITSLFSDLGLEVMKAEIGSFDGHVNDKFYIVDDVTGAKLSDQKDTENVKKCIETLLTSRGKTTGGGKRPDFTKEPEPTSETLYTLMDTYIKNDVLSIQQSIVNHAEYTLARSRFNFDNQEAYQATAYSLRDRLIESWNDTQNYFREQDPKRVYYLSMEFLMGRSLLNTLYNLNVKEPYTEALRELGYDLETVMTHERDAALGNGGLGRLAACFLDSMATLDLPAWGYGIRYEYGMFRQSIVDGFQHEQPDYWLNFGNPWEIERLNVNYDVAFYGHVSVYQEDGRQIFKWNPGEQVTAVAFDNPIPGFGTNNTINLRLWAAKPSKAFDLQAFNTGDYVQAILAKQKAETISSVLYPDDRTYKGKELRLRQQHFLCSATIQDVVRRYKERHSTFDAFSKKCAFQLNDTHPTIAVPELMRVLMDENKLGWTKSWEITTKVFAFTNHTVLPEALEKWPVTLVEKLLPRHMQIIYDINWRFLQELKLKYGDDWQTISSMSIIEDTSGGKVIRMAYLAVVASQYVNGVAAIHSELIQKTIFKNFSDLFPGKFQNKTNGVTQRRWLAFCNPGLRELITESLGTEDWIKELNLLTGLREFVDDPEFVERWIYVKNEAKAAALDYIEDVSGIKIPRRVMLDMQIKRIHEYKRQLLNIFGIIWRYDQIKQMSLEQRQQVVPRVCVIGGKAAPGYETAKRIIKLVCAVGETINGDSDIGDLMKVVFVADYNVSSAEKLIPGCELSQHISTAGTEASGTSNMKFAMNGCLIAGTMDGANVEIAEEIGAENMFIFGADADDVPKLRKERETFKPDGRFQHVIDVIEKGTFGWEDYFKPLIASVTGTQDQYLVANDFPSYIEMQDTIERTYKDQEKWTRMSILSVAGSGKFSSDRTIEEYARDIWDIEPLSVPSFE